jgi:hypothetical protein
MDEMALGPVAPPTRPVPPGALRSHCQFRSGPQRPKTIRFCRNAGADDARLLEPVRERAERPAGCGVRRRHDHGLPPAHRERC